MYDDREFIRKTWNENAMNLSLSEIVDYHSDNTLKIQGKTYVTPYLNPHIRSISPKISYCNLLEDLKQV